MKGDSDRVAEPDLLERLEEPLPSYITVIKEQRARLYMESHEIVANGNVLMLDGSVVAIKPFPKSKTGFALELRFATSSPPKDTPSVVSKYDETTNTYRHIFLDYPLVVLAPHEFGTYRGKKVMGILHAQIVLEKPRIWSLDYTLFFAPLTSCKAPLASGKR